MKALILLLVVVCVGCGGGGGSLLTCEFCKESDIKEGATVCKHCGKDPLGAHGALMRKVNAGEAQVEYGWILYSGKDVEMNIEAAVKLFLLAATSGDGTTGNQSGKLAYARICEEGLVAGPGTNEKILGLVMAYAWYSLVPNKELRRNKLKELEYIMDPSTPSGKNMILAGKKMSFDIARKYPKAAPWKLKPSEPDPYRNKM